MSTAIGNLVAEALLNGLWRGILVLAAAWCLLGLFRPRSAAVRYIAWSTVLAAIAVLPFAQFAVSGRPGLKAPVMPETRVLLPVPEEIESEALLPITVPAGAAAWILLSVWATGTILLGLRLATGYRRLVNLKRGSDAPPEQLRRWSERWEGELHSGRTPEIRSSHGTKVPLTVGLGKPAVLFPVALVSQLTEREAHSIWLHETAHVRRRDDWTNLGQRLVETVLFFHPAVHWIGRRLNLEREIACDDWVVARTGAARSYAECLTKLAEFASRGPCAAPALAMAADKKQIFRRVEMLVSKRHPKTLRSQAGGVAVVMLLVVFIAAIGLMKPLFVLAQPPDDETVVVAPAPPAPPEPPARAGVVTLPVPPAPPAPAAQATGSTPPTPPASPAPAARPQPAPAPAPRVSTERLPENVRKEFEQKMHAQADQMRALADEMRKEVDTNIRANVEEIRKLTDQIRAKVHSQIQPSIEQIHKLQQQVHEQIRSAKPDEEAKRKLESQIQDVQESTIRKAEEEIRALESQIRSFESKMRPSEETLRQFERKMRDNEEKMRQLERELERRANESQTKEASPAPGRVN